MTRFLNSAQNEVGQSKRGGAASWSHQIIILFGQFSQFSPFSRRPIRNPKFGPYAVRP